MKEMLPALRSPGVNHLDNDSLPALIAEAGSALERRQYRAILAPAIAEALEQESAIWILGDAQGELGALEEARHQGLRVAGFINPQPKQARASHEGVRICGWEEALVNEPHGILVAALRGLKQLQNVAGASVALFKASVRIYSPAGRQTWWSFAEGNLPNETPIPFGIEILNGAEVRGFCPRNTPLAEVQLKMNGQDAGLAAIGLEPPGGHERVEFRGFFKPASIPESACTLEVAFKSKSGASIRLIHADQFPAVMSMESSRYVPGRDQPFQAPFPYDVALALHRFNPGRYPQLKHWNDATLAAAVVDLHAMDRDHSPVAPVRAYLGYLRSMARRFAFIRRRFPRLNSSRSGNLFALDALAAGTIPEEVLAIAHHIYVLASYGLRGTLAEFGCYKGLSTCMLSLACRENGFRLHVFDSFEGLPEASATGFNQPGQFSGSPREVQDRVAEFGAPEVVEYSTGFFSDTVPCSEIKPACIWMDVDLRSSVKDILGPLFSRLPRQSCIFCHDIRGDALSLRGPKVFQDAAEEVLVPTVEAFESCQRPVSVRFLAGFTTAFWETGQGFPALSNDLIQVLVPEPVIN